MGGYYPQYWRLELWEHESVSPVKEYFEQIGRIDPKAHRLMKHKIRGLLAVPLIRLERAQVLRDQKNGLWELEVSAGGLSHSILGPLQQASWGTTLIAMEGFHGGGETERLVAEAIAQGRLITYKEHNLLQHNLHGLQ